MWYLLLILPVLGLSWGYIRVRQRVLRHRPERYPGRIPKRSDAVVVVCAGDSLTHGNVSVNYVDILLERFVQRGYQFFNAGINSDLTYTLLDRLNDVVKLQPDVVTLLIGTNDVQASLSEEKRVYYVRSEKIRPDVTPDLAGFQENYRELLRRLRSETRARVAVASLPPMGEDPASDVNRRADQYSAFVKQLTEEQGVTYLPVRERMLAYLAQNGRGTYHDYEKTSSLVTNSVLRHYWLGQSWDAITQRRGHVLTHDNLHLNTVGATFVADAITEFLEQPPA